MQMSVVYVPQTVGKRCGDNTSVASIIAFLLQLLRPGRSGLIVWVTAEDGSRALEAGGVLHHSAPTRSYSTFVTRTKSSLRCARRRIWSSASQRRSTTYERGKLTRMSPSVHPAQFLGDSAGLIWKS